jgi:hypothetical protein
MAFAVGCLFLWLILRLLFARSGSRMRRIIGLWFEAKERELRRRTRKPDS